MLLTALHSCLGEITAIANQSHKLGFGTQKQCSRLLESTIFKPNSCAYKYLHKLGESFRVRAQALFTPLASQFIYNFEVDNRVVVGLVDAFGQQVIYNFNGTASVGEPAQYSDTAQAFLNFPGFTRQVSLKSFYYTFQVYSPDAKYYAVTFQMPLEDDPIFC